MGKTTEKQPHKTHARSKKKSGSQSSSNRVRSISKAQLNALDKAQEETGRASLEALARVDLPPAAKYALIRDRFPEVPAYRAAELSGYSPNTASTNIERTPTYQEWAKALRAKRIELANRPGLRLEDSATYYDDMSRDKIEVDPQTRLKARQALDSVLGHNAPKEVMQTVEAGESGIPEFVEFIKGMGLTPAQIKAQLAHPTEYQDITPEGAS